MRGKRKQRKPLRCIPYMARHDRRPEKSLRINSHERAKQASHMAVITPSSPPRRHGVAPPPRGGAGREPEIKTQPDKTHRSRSSAPRSLGAKRIKHRNREAPTQQRGGKGREGEGWRRRHSLPRAARLRRGGRRRLLALVWDPSGGIGIGTGYILSSTTTSCPCRPACCETSGRKGEEEGAPEY
jgi:hypothetical protein